MGIVSVIAEYFICWWITLFIVLPIGLRTQADEKTVINGTISSAPAKFRPMRVFVGTTALAAVLYACWYIATRVYGLNALSIPRIVPEFH